LYGLRMLCRHVLASRVPCPCPPGTTPMAVSEAYSSSDGLAMVACEVCTHRGGLCGGDVVTM
jgi:hypothetical protein